MKAIVKQNGFNDSERYLSKICEKTFLSLWSYPNLYTDEGKKTKNSDGKELCDLLVVFNKHIIIFSDKDIAFKDTGNISVDWARWVKKSVLKSAIQLFGAETWILSRSDRIFLDKKCNHKFPHEFPSRDEVKIHRIAIARNATKKFEEYSHSSGSLIITPEIVGDEHLNSPFEVGRLISGKPYVHVFDEITLDVVMGELDTISDFIEYIEKKEILIESGKLLSAAGEEELLAFYLMSAEGDRAPDFYIEDGVNAVIAEGYYSYLTNLPQYKSGREQDRVSFFWDSFIEHFSKHVLGGTLINDNNNYANCILALQIMASERRVARRALSRSILLKLKQTPVDELAVRVMQSPTIPSNVYVWLAVPIPLQAKVKDDYRKYRAFLLEVYCQSAKLIIPSSKYIVGIATPPFGIESDGEDIMYIDTTKWSEDDFLRARQEREEYCILLEKNIIKYEDTEYQYPR